MLASSNPLGVIFAGLFLRYLAKGGDSLVTANYNRYISDIIVAVIIYFAGFSRLIIDLLTKQQRKLTEKVNVKIAKQREVGGEQTVQETAEPQGEPENIEIVEGEKQAEPLEESEKDPVPVDENKGEEV